MCLFQSKFLSSQIPRNLVWVQHGIAKSPNFKSILEFVSPFGLNTTQIVLSAFKVNLFALNQSVMTFRSCSISH